MATVLKGMQKGKGGSLKQSGKTFSYTERRRYIVISSVPNDSILNVLNTTGLPKVMVTSIPGTSGQCVCTGLDPKQDEGSPYTWFVDAEFSTSNEKQETGGDPDPTTWIPVYSAKIETYPEVLYEDFSTPKKKYLNSARDKFPEPLIVKRPIIVYDFFQYEPATLTEVEIGDRNDTVNIDEFRGFAAETLKLTVSGMEYGFFYGYPAVRVNYSVAYKKNKWLNVPLNVGYSYLLDGVRTPSDVLVALNSDGTKKADTAIPDTLTFKENPQIEFDDFLR